MFFFLPLFFLFFCSVSIRRKLAGWRPALLLSAVITASVLTAITEILSLVQALSFYPLLIIWLLLTIMAGLKAFGDGPVLWPSVNFKDWTLGEKMILGIIVFISGVTAVTAAFSVPNTWDSMTYHLPRVAHWIQNKTVAFYPTNIVRQLFSPPWAEYAIAHLRILGGGDTSANFVQWLAMAGSLAGVSLIAGELGAGRRGQLTAAAIAACLPMGILQSVSTQTDYAGSFWLVVFVYFLIESAQPFSIFYCIVAGLSLGLAWLTKGTSYILAVPFLIGFAWVNFRQRFARWLAGLLLIFVCAAGLNLGQYWRNTQTFGFPTWTNASLTNASFDLKVLWVNILRNMSIHWATPFKNINENIEQTVTKAAGLLGADINDPRASVFTKEFTISGPSFDEDYAGNFFHAILFSVVFVLLGFYRFRKKIGFYVFCVLSSFMLFCLIVRFQTWNVRFHLPFFILFCPVAGVVLEYFLKRKAVFLAIVLFLGAGPGIFLNHQHPWFGHRSIWKQPRLAQYFYKHADLAWPYVAIAQHIKSMGCRQIGLVTGEDNWEYPWWVFLEGPGVRIEHVGVNNPSGALKYPLGNFDACIVIAHGPQPPPFIMSGISFYGPVGSLPAGNDKLTVYLKK